jgi:hypothetical protein
MGFWQRQQVRVAMRYLTWQYDKAQQPVPQEPELEQRAQVLVAEANRIAQRTGKNVLGILKDLINELKR